MDFATAAEDQPTQIASTDESSQNDANPQPIETASTLPQPNLLAAA
jgi:hypothetical protein